MLAGVVRRVDPANVAEGMVARFRTEIAGYRRLPEPVVIGQILEICRQNVELFFGSILDGTEPAEADLAAFRQSARDRAGEGMPLEDLLHAYRLGGRMGWQAVVEAARPDERHALLTGAELLMDYVDLVSAVVAQAYLDERQHLVSEEERGLRDLFDALVSGRAVGAGCWSAPRRSASRWRTSTGRLLRRLPARPRPNTRRSRRGCARGGCWRSPRAIGSRA